MADAIYEWAGTIVSYMVFVTVLSGLLPAARYVKYLRLFSGCILILLVVRPLTGGLRMEESIEHFFRSISFENEVSDLTGLLEEELDEAEEKRLERVVTAYEEEVGSEILRLAEAAGFAADRAAVSVGRNPEAAGFGEIKSIILTLEKADISDLSKTAGAPQAEEQRAELGETDDGSVMAGAGGNFVEGIEVERVKVGKDAVRAAKDLAEADEKEKAADGTAASLRQLKRQIAAYYQVEEAYVEIRMED